MLIGYIVANFSEGNKRGTSTGRRRPGTVRNDKRRGSHPQKPPLAPVLSLLYSFRELSSSNLQSCPPWPAIPRYHQFPSHVLTLISPGVRSSAPCASTYTAITCEGGNLKKPLRGWKLKCHCLHCREFFSGVQLRRLKSRSFRNAPGAANKRLLPVCGGSTACVRATRDS